MGSIMSGHWEQVKRAVLVEQCSRRNATRCPICHRAIRFVYALPKWASPQFSGWKCRICHGLQHKSKYTKALENHRRRIEFAAAIGERIEGARTVRRAYDRWKNGGDLRAPTMEQEPETAIQIK